jgi:hypothetical protein
MIPQNIIDKAKQIASRALSIHGWSATATQFRFIVREIAFRIHDREISRYEKMKAAN